MVRLAKILATCLGIGYIPKGGGTVAALVCCITWYFLHPGLVMQGVLIMSLLGLGVWSAGLMETDWGKDSPRVVIDEVQGMCLTLFWIPDHWLYLLAGLIFFRFFDIAKPLYIRRLERLRRGWGVMMDDVLAGIYANLLLQALVRIIP